jgi:hypothetical protein
MTGHFFIRPKYMYTQWEEKFNYSLRNKYSRKMSIFLHTPSSRSPPPPMMILETGNGCKISSKSRNLSGAFRDTVGCLRF